MTDGSVPLLRTLVAQAVAAVHHADDDEFLLRCIVLSGHDHLDVRQALLAHRDEPTAVPTTPTPPTDPHIVRELEPERVAATVRYLDTGEVGGADEVERIIDAVLLLATSPDDPEPER